MTTSDANTKSLALANAQAILLGRIFQILDRQTGSLSKGMEAALVSAGLTQAEVGQILGKTQSAVSDSISSTKKGAK
jgi:hypothetical protein